MQKLGPHAIVARACTAPTSFQASLERVGGLEPQMLADLALGIPLAWQPGAADRMALAAAGTILVTEPRAVRCADLDVEIGDLFETFVTPAEIDNDEPREKRRSTRFIKSRMNDFFKKLGVLKKLANDEEAQQLRVVQCRSGVKHTFDFAYRNGAIHRIEPISFDYGTILERIARARSFANMAEDVLGSPDGQDSVIEAVIQAPAEPLEPEVYEQAKKILGTVAVTQTEVRDDADLERFCARTSAQLHS